MELDLGPVDGTSVVLALCAFAIFVAWRVVRHARKRLKLSREAMRDTDYPGYG